MNIITEKTSKLLRKKCAIQKTRKYLEIKRKILNNINLRGKKVNYLISISIRIEVYFSFLTNIKVNVVQ